MKLYLSEYGKFKPRDAKGKEGVVCVFTPFQVFDEEREQKVWKGYFFTTVPETIERLDRHPDKGNGFIEWSASSTLPRMIRGRLIAGNTNILEMDEKRLARIEGATGQPVVKSEIMPTGEKGVVSEHTKSDKASPEDWVKYGEIKGKWLKNDGEFAKNTPEETRNEFNKLKEKLGV